MKSAAILLIVTTLLPVGAARAHRKNYIPKGYVSNISAVVPNVLGVSVNVIGGDERLRLSNYSGKAVVILGYQGEPYLRFDRVGRVRRTSARRPSYLNRDRKPGGLKPRDRGPDGGSSLAAGRRAAPRTSGTTTGSTGRRTGRPKACRLHPDRIQRIFTWRVPGRADGRPFAITGLLGYAPPQDAESSSGDWLEAAGLGAAGALAAAPARGRRRWPAAGSGGPRALS